MQWFSGLKLLVAAQIIVAVEPAIAGVSPHEQCTFAMNYPRHYVAHFAKEPPDFDGKLDDRFWTDVPWTEDFVDIAQGPTPRKKTRAKMRWDNEFLYVGAFMEEDEIWANMTDNEVIFHDNDFEVFVDPSGSTHYYKEFEINAVDAKWSLCLNKPYGNGGYENSTRVLGHKGYGIGGRSAIFVNGKVNDASVVSRSWTVELALPLSDLVVNHTGATPEVGKYWRLDFSRVEWKVARSGDKYIKEPMPQAEDNWVWQPIGAIAMHNPERWGVLQFADANIGATSVVHDASWPARYVAAAIYDAEVEWAKDHGGDFTDSLEELQKVAPARSAAAIDGAASCTGTPHVTLGADRKSFNARVASIDASHEASINEDRFLAVTYK